MALAVAVLASLAGAGSAAAQQPAVLPAQTIAGPAAGVVSLGGIAIARDGTGAIAYLAQTGGATHVFVSRLSGGSFGPPVQADAGLAAASSQPVIAAGNGGELQCAFVNGGELYVTQAPSAGAPLAAPQALYAGAQNPSISMSNFGKAYLAFAATGDGGEDVRVAYFDTHAWSLVPGPFNARPGDDAGTGSGRPGVVAAGDGVGIVAWGEGGHVYARRVWGVQLGAAATQLDPPSVGGAAVTGTAFPEVAAGGNSSYVDVVFQASVDAGAAPQTRDLIARLRAEATLPAVPFDGIGTVGGTQGGDSAGVPALSMNEYGRGFAAAADLSSGEVIAAPLATNGAPGAPAAVGTAPVGVDAHPTPAAAGLISNLLAWQAGTSAADAEIVASYAPDGSQLGQPLPLSGPSGGPPQAAAGLGVGGDSEGDAAVAWVQGAPGALAVEAAQMLQPPGQAAPTARLSYVRNAQPRLAWNAAREQWGPLTYTVTLDGSPVGQTTGTSLVVPVALVDGPHVWQVGAANPAGQTSVGPVATVFVDTAPPLLRIGFTGRPRARRELALRVNAQDVPPPEAGAQASGIAKVTVRWGDGTPVLSAARLGRARHVYKRAGLYRLVVTASDRAGNATRIVRYVRVLR